MRFLLKAMFVVAGLSGGCDNTSTNPPAATTAWTPPAVEPVATGVVRLSVPGAGILEVSPASVDFGMVAPASTHPVTFTLSNTGAAPITIATVTTSCACTSTSDIDGVSIPAGGAIDLDAALVAPRQPEEKTSRVFLRVAGVNQTVGLELKGDVTLPIRATPPFADALKGVTSGSIRLRSMDGQPFTVLSSNGNRPIFVGFDPAKDTPRAAYDVAWSIAGMSCESIPRWWVFVTDRSDCPLVPCRVRNECTGTKRDSGRFERFWIFSDYLLDGGDVSEGESFVVQVDLEHTNPRGRGAIVNPAWKNVLGATATTEDAVVSLESIAAVDNETVSLSLRVTVAPDVQGLLYLPVLVQTETGSGLVDVVAKVGK